MPEQQFSTELKLRIDWSELDYFGHVNNVSFFKYIQSSRVNYWDKIKLTRLHQETNIGPILASCKCDFKRPLFYPGQVTVFARTEFIKNTSFGIYHRLVDEAGNIVAEAQDIIVIFDFNRNEKVLFPIELQENIQRLDNREF